MNLHTMNWDSLLTPPPLWIMLCLAIPFITMSEEQCQGDNTEDCSQPSQTNRYMLNENGGWETPDGTKQAAEPGPCNIDIHDASFSREDFLKRYSEKAPVILKGITNNEMFSKLCTKESLLEKYGSKIVRLSTANTYSYDKFDVPLRKYITHYLKPQSLSSLGNETYYWFGDNNHTEWKELFDVYKAPPYFLPGMSGAYSFGVAGAGTGVPFHFHGPGFAEVIYGRKRWFLYPYEQEPKFDPDKSTLDWVANQYPKLAEYQKPYECTIGPGEVIYFPHRWWHATLNIDTSVFISTFLGYS